MTTRGKGDGIAGNRQGFRAQLSQKTAKIVSARADWDYEDRQGVMTGNIRMTQGDNSGTCERINYDEAGNVAQLVGNVRFRDNKNRVFNAPNLTIYINESRIVAENPVLSFEPDRKPTPKPAAPRTRILEVKPPPVISEEDMKLFANTAPTVAHAASAPPPALRHQLRLLNLRNRRKTIEPVIPQLPPLRFRTQSMRRKSPTVAIPQLRALICVPHSRFTKFSLLFDGVSDLPNGS
jgi:hypothetical protein